MNREEIESGLRSLGLKEGDKVLLHSSLSSLGRVAGGAETVVEAFLSVLGPSGTLVVPTFGKLGVIPETVKKHPRAVRSVHPLASAAAIGADAEAICRDHWKAELAHGEGTPYMRLADLGGYACLLGVDQDRSTTLHTAEELLRLPYLKPNTKTFETPDGSVTKTFPFFPGPHRDFIGLDRMLRESGRMKVGRIGDSVARLMRCRDLIDLCLEVGRRDSAFALCGNPNCADCVRQRADLRRARFAKEAFALGASASLAGRYVEEIGDQCKAASIDAVELDAVRGRPVSMLDASAITRAVERLREEGVRVAGLRLNAAIGKGRTEKILRAACEASVRRLVAPLTHDAPAQAALAQSLGVGISFYNVCVDGATASAMLLDMKEKGLAAGFTFNAANFARAGETPFLKSYKAKLNRFVDQLDVEDALYDGPPGPLGEGNAEIKEMISVLRCASFPGAMVLGAGNRFAGDLSDAVRGFERLLDSM